MFVYFIIFSKTTQKNLENTLFWCLFFHILLDSFHDGLKSLSDLFKRKLFHWMTSLAIIHPHLPGKLHVTKI